MSGRRPICARISAANRPHGPVPITTGRGVSVRLLAAGDELVAGVRRRHQVLVVLEALEQRGLVLDFDVERVDQHDRRFLRAS
jgi:hypothetical protein